MAPPQLQTTIEKLPDHLLSNILVRVPARTLAQMRSVSKPLNALLSKPSFIQSHLHRSIETNDEILLVFKHLYSSEVSAHPSTSPHLEFPNFIQQLPFYDCDGPSDKYEGHGVIGAVNGLICFYYLEHDFSIQIWNPSISALLVLQHPCTCGDQNKFRFACDPYNDDYKVVRLAVFCERSEVSVRVEVFSMRKGCWEFITERFPAHLFIYDEGDKVCGDGHDGRLHWLCFDGDNHKIETIVAFDLGAERMSEIGLPVDNTDRKNVLGVLGGKLCLMSCFKDHRCEVWLMNEYGNVESWAKQHVFSQFSENGMNPFGFTLSNEFLFASFDVLSMYDPIAAKVKSFMFKVGPYAKFVPYVDSLVWITPDKRKRRRKRCRVSTCNSSDKSRIVQDSIFELAKVRTPRGTASAVPNFWAGSGRVDQLIGQFMGAEDYLVPVSIQIPPETSVIISRPSRAPSRAGYRTLLCGRPFHPEARREV
ncbi:hypothetical protein OSB04_018394 [Centaurea solstitialis]|uniref:F-box domain-containing protein n=1 Tax=Centaurea solstitialis TaxID=347529 RepID=A0AA38T6F9_9ASTR|nr:hypothetical protein OSB04_018394 [Centaurea solstitialis]